MLRHKTAILGSGAPPQRGRRPAAPAPPLLRGNFLSHTTRKRGVNGDGKSPFAPLSEEAAKSPKAHRLTAEEKEIKAAVMDTLKGQIAYNNDGMRASYRASNHSFNLLARNGVRIEGNTVTQNGEPLFKIHRRHATRKTQGCYRELLPTLEYVKQGQKQEKPSIRDQLKAAAKQQPEKKSPVKSKTHDMEL